MDDLDLDSGIFEWMVDRPGAATLFENLGIDCSCGGKSLRYACEQRGIDANLVFSQLAALRPVEHCPDSAVKPDDPR